MGLAYYQKYRPIQLTDLIGQERVVTAIGKQSEQQEMSHAYMLVGQLGSGKTSIARILSTLLTCQNRVGSQVCGTCDSCKAIHEGQCIDVIEIDAASNGGIDNAREIGRAHV